jgi:hypothetical protein
MVQWKHINARDGTGSSKLIQNSIKTKVYHILNSSCFISTDVSTHPAEDSAGKTCDVTMSRLGSVAGLRR